MRYHVERFVAHIGQDENSQQAAKQLADRVNQMAEQGWEFQGIETITTLQHIPATKGCFGNELSPARVDSIMYDLAVFVHRQ